ncbi:MAG: molybdenum cofactor biosynthesis protein MoaE [Thaumarchaeota archaeon]|nr:molybdenum cofactor biosynthesis protein MoaE [Candidatus Calditenuaceae archaeon]MCX8203018.1 molybdenum cofactor biosynthesis protein MoaE [Nitrososphaeria archaeon]MDW8043579.1 molybdenum cofactor biosynthesis protein MoaE [Nitrososphaerota archaeon]
MPPAEGERSELLSVPRTGVYAKGSLDLVAVYDSLSSAYGDGSSGALATFMGIARSTSRTGKRVVEVVIEAYVENAELELRRIVSEATERHNLTFAGIWHLLGPFRPGEPIVLVASMGPRRKGVMDALAEMVERYKREPALFKKEVYADGTSEWVEE